MAKTISTHNGSAANREHNVRNPRATDKQQHIDKSLQNQNETLHDEKPREAYKRIFGAALEAYNAKQKRPERRIKDYYTHVCKDAKRHPVYEMIIQIGSRQDTGLDAPVERECLREFYQGWAERNPSLECIGAYIHADETDGTLHMHVDYVPVARGYKRGLETQSALVAALAQQGIKMDKDHPRTAQIQWEARENAALEAICVAHGIEVIHPQRTGEQLQHLDTATYKAKAELAEVKADLTEAKEELEDVQDVLQRASDELSEQLDMAQDAQHRAEDAQMELTDLQGKIEELQPRAAAIEDDVQTLERRRTDLRSEVAELQGQLQDAKDELQLVEQALTRRQAEGQAAFGAVGWLDRIGHIRKQDAQDARLKSLEAFVAQPQVKPLWEQFQPFREAARGHREGKGYDRGD